MFCSMRDPKICHLCSSTSFSSKGPIHKSIQIVIQIASHVRCFRSMSCWTLHLSTPSAQDELNQKPSFLAQQHHPPLSLSMEQCPSSSSAAASKFKAPSCSQEDNTSVNRMLQDVIVVRLQQHMQEQQAQFLQAPTQPLLSQTPVLDDSSLQTKRQSNVNGALHSNEAGAAKSIFNRPSAVKATNAEMRQLQAQPFVCVFKRQGTIMSVLHVETR
jgi:hypothetical protein